MDGVNRPGAGQQVPPADEDKDKENVPPEAQQKQQTSVGQRIKGRSLTERFKRGGGIKTVDGEGPSVRPTNTPSAKDDAEDAS